MHYEKPLAPRVMMRTAETAGTMKQFGFDMSVTIVGRSFTQERFNALRYYKVDGDRQHHRVPTIEASTARDPYICFCVAAGDQIGTNDLKIIEVGVFLATIDGGALSDPDFRPALEIQELVNAVIIASKSRHRIQF